MRLPVGEAPTTTEGLYPLQALVQPIALRFKYHFDGARQTNRLDKVRAKQQPFTMKKDIVCSRPVFAAGVVLYARDERRARAPRLYGLYDPAAARLNALPRDRRLGAFP
jgi:hypothetical protein